MCEAVNVRTIRVGDVPVEAIEFLKPLARSNGHSESDAAVARFAIVELARRIKEAATRVADAAAAHHAVTGD